MSHFTATKYYYCRVAASVEVLLFSIYHPLFLLKNELCKLWLNRTKSHFPVEWLLHRLQLLLTAVKVLSTYIVLLLSEAEWVQSVNNNKNEWYLFKCNYAIPFVNPSLISRNFICIFKKRVFQALLRDICTLTLNKEIILLVSTQILIFLFVLYSDSCQY